LTAKGRLSTTLPQRLLSAPGRFAGDHLRLGICVLSRVYASDNSSATYVATLEGHISSTVFSVAFHATAPLLATGSSDRTANLWRLSCDNLSAT
jgi:WD40 repeat protein